ncbi:MAG: hypothetical protein K0S20_293 [Patescibacteria group bacterium]|jgi:hypothetical protein|nr:hypothetical protein [Patescibacteria group bacterium]
MLQVDLNNILSEEDALTRIKEVFDHVENQKEIYVVTKNDRPVLAIVDIDHLENGMNGMTMESSTPAPSPQTAPPAPAPMPAPEPPMATPAEFSMPFMETIPTETAAPLQDMPDMITPTFGSNPLPPPPVEAPSGSPLSEDLPDMPEEPGNSSPLS